MGGELLGDDVLVDHAEVHGQLVRQELPVHDVVGEVRVLEGEGHEQAGVRQVQFELPQVDARGKTRARVVGVASDEHGPRILELRDLFEDIL